MTTDTRTYNDAETLSRAAATVPRSLAAVICLADRACCWHTDRYSAALDQWSRGQGNSPAMWIGYPAVFGGPMRLPTRAPRFDRYGHAWCRTGCPRNGRAIGGDGLCDACRQDHPAEYGHGVS